MASNMATFGGGAFLEGPEARIQDSTLHGNGNDLTVGGGGAFVLRAGWLSGCSIEGNFGGNGGGVRLFQGGVISNCVIQFNQCRADGGGVQCYEGGLVDRCIVASNEATFNGTGNGGGVDLISGGWLRNSLVRDNSATYYGGGVRMIYGGTVDSCTIVANTSTNLTNADGGGLACWWGGLQQVRNSIIWGNSSGSGAPNWDVYGGTAVFEYCCTTPVTGLPGGDGCFDADPLFQDPLTSDYQLRNGSLCIDTGRNLDWMITARDLPGHVRILEEIVDLGADESVGILHVWTNSPLPTPPYNSWGTAAHVIQDAVDEAITGDLVLVTNGVYGSGGRPAGSARLGNRVVVDKAIRVESVSGWEHTFILGQGVGSGGTNVGEGAVRCAYLGPGAWLSGFTLTNGHTLADGSHTYDYSGGGVAGSSWDPHGSDVANLSVVSNCQIIACSAVRGGGVMGGMVVDSRVVQNRASRGGGGSGGLFLGCEISANTAEVGEGGGIFEAAILQGCIIMSNRALAAVEGRGGGVAGWGLDLYNCLLTGNSATEGGGAFVYADSGLFQCTVAGNLATEQGGGIFVAGNVENSIIHHNTAEGDPVSANYIESTNLVLMGACTDPGREGVITTSDPRFIDPEAGDYRLGYGSPCLDAVVTPSTFTATHDLRGTLRPYDGDFNGVSVSDLGADEYDPSSHDSDRDGMMDDWELEYGFNPTNALDAAENHDRDPPTNLEEYLADTDPTNDLSYLRIVAFSNHPPWTVFFWPASTRRYYTLEWTENPTITPWTNSPGQTRIPGIAGIQALSDVHEDSYRTYRVGAAP